LRFTNANRAYQELSGYTEQELCALTFLDLTHPDDHSLLLDATGDLLSGRARERQIEMRKRRRAGDVIWVRATASVIHEMNDSPRILALIEDITPRKRAEQALAASLDHMRALAAKLMRAQDEERRRIAQMLHET